jgi:hypothetical protein
LYPVRTPRRVALLTADPGSVTDVFVRLDTRALPVRRDDLVGAIIADPGAPGQRARLAESLRGWGVVVGMAVPPEELPATLRGVTVAMELRRSGVLDSDPLFVEEHLDALVVHSDPRLFEVLSRQALQPLDGLPPGARARLEQTLEVWLRSLGDRQEVARALHVHPQTVRYRLGQLRRLFGPTLDDPRARLTLTLALCWRPLPGAQGDELAS